MEDDHGSIWNALNVNHNGQSDVVSLPISGAGDGDGYDDLYLDSLPDGYRFMPTEEELIESYLEKKIQKKLLPPNRIRHVDFYKFTPDKLAEEYPLHREKERYFFTSRDKKYTKGSRPSRAVKGLGFWKATGREKAVRSSSSGGIIGHRKMLVFYLGNTKHNQKTSWVMLEYVVPSSNRQHNNQKDNILDDYVIVKLYENSERKKRKKRSKRESDDHGEPATPSSQSSEQPWPAPAGHASNTDLPPNFHPSAPVTTQMNYNCSVATAAPQLLNNSGLASANSFPPEQHMISRSTPATNPDLYQSQWSFPGSTPATNPELYQSQSSFPGSTSATNPELYQSQLSFPSSTSATNPELYQSQSSFPGSTPATNPLCSGDQLRYRGEASSSSNSRSVSVRTNSVRPAGGSFAPASFRPVQDMSNANVGQPFNSQPGYYNEKYRCFKGDEDDLPSCDINADQIGLDQQRLFDEFITGSKGHRDDLPSCDIKVDHIGLDQQRLFDEFITGSKGYGDDLPSCDIKVDQIELDQQRLFDEFITGSKGHGDDLPSCDINVDQIVLDQQRLFDKFITRSKGHEDDLLSCDINADQIGLDQQRLFDEFIIGSKGHEDNCPSCDINADQIVRDQQRLFDEFITGSKGHEDNCPSCDINVDQIVRDQQRLFNEFITGSKGHGDDLPSCDINVDQIVRDQQRLLDEFITGSNIQTAHHAERADWSSTAVPPQLPAVGPHPMSGQVTSHQRTFRA